MTGGLAKLTAAFSKIKHVIHDLECHPDIGAVFAESLDVRLRSIPNDGAHLCRPGKQGRGLAKDSPFVLVSSLIEAM